MENQKKIPKQCLGRKFLAHSLMHACAATQPAQPALVTAVRFRSGGQHTRLLFPFFFFCRQVGPPTSFYFPFFLTRRCFPSSLSAMAADWKPSKLVQFVRIILRSCAHLNSRVIPHPTAPLTFLSLPNFVIFAGDAARPSWAIRRTRATLAL